MLNERVKSLEALLTQSGVITGEALEQFEPTQEQDAQWAQARFQLIKDVLESGANIT